MLVRGEYSDFLDYWPEEISHNSKAISEKEIRYQVGKERLWQIKMNAEPFAFLMERDEKYMAYLVELDDADLHEKMPLCTRYEYICGKETKGGEKILFSYLWFEKLNDAISYAKKHGMKIERGWV